MIALQPIHTDHALYLFVEKLLQSAFPKDERRDDAQQRAYTDRNPKFHCLLIRDFDQPVGLLTYWDFADFVYIEHFAIHENYRNKGYGQKVMEFIINEIKGMIVLEAEEPSDDITYRRIRFYQRLGFVMQDVPYQQPPYRSEDQWFPMKLMTLREKNFSLEYEEVKRKIYKEAYNIIE